WALASFLFMAVFIPIVWLAEPGTNKTQLGGSTKQSGYPGSKEVQLFSETNILGVGCVRCHGPNLAGGHNLYKGLIVQVPSLQQVCAGPTAPVPVKLHNSNDMQNIIMQGIP